MSWVSTSKLDSLSKSFRNKFATKSLTIADAEKTSGVNISNVGSNGNITITPSSYGDDNGTELYLGGAAGSNNMQITNGSISVVDSTGSRGITLSTTADNIVLAKDGSGTLRVSGVSDPTDNNDAVNKTYADRFLPNNMNVTGFNATRASSTSDSEDTIYTNRFNLKCYTINISLNRFLGHKGYFRVIGSVTFDSTFDSYTDNGVINSYMKFDTMYNNKYNVAYKGRTSTSTYMGTAKCSSIETTFNEGTNKLTIYTNYFPFDFTDVPDDFNIQFYRVELDLLLKVVNNSELIALIEDKLSPNLESLEYIITE